MEMMLTSLGKNAVASCILTKQGREAEALHSTRPRYPDLKAASPLPKPCNQKGGAGLEFLSVLVIITIISYVAFVFFPDFLATEAKEFCESQGMKYEGGWFSRAKCSRIEKGYIIHKSFEKIENEWYEVKEG